MRFCVGLLLLIFPATLSPNVLPRLWVWNVGQGQWVTFSDVSACLHFDSGGEYFPLQKIQSECRDKANRFYFSHWDWDHISFANQFLNFSSRVCVARLPGGPTPNSETKKRLLLIPRCENQIPLERNLERWSPPPLKPTRGTNDQSHVYRFQNILIPGDSTSRMEKQWAPRLAPGSRVLILGHHGSRSSTSNALLNHAAQVRMAFVSARHARYGHPHLEVLSRLQKHGVSVIKTEDWGTLEWEASLSPVKTESSQSAMSIETRDIPSADHAQRAHSRRTRHTRLNP